MFTQKDEHFHIRIVVLFTKLHLQNDNVIHSTNRNTKLSILISFTFSFYQLVILGKFDGISVFSYMYFIYLFHIIIVIFVSRIKVLVFFQCLYTLVNGDAVLILLFVYFRHIENLELKAFKFMPFGKEFIKGQKLSPDAFVQVNLQLAYYRYV